jgi:hypothetical protein
MGQVLIATAILGAFLYFITFLFSKSVIVSFLVSAVACAILYFFNFSDQALAVTIGDVANNFATAITKIAFVSCWAFGAWVMYRLTDGPLEWS